MPGRPSGDDEEEDGDEDAPVETDTGSASPTAQGSDLGELLLDLTCAMVKASILLGEADAEAWKECAPRIEALRSAMLLFPTKAPKERRVGFEPPKPTRARAAKRGRGRS